MNQQQRDAYIQMREEEVYGRREPSIGSWVLQVPTAQQREYVMQQSDKQTRRQGRANILKLVLWLAAWFSMLCACEVAAEALHISAHDTLLVQYTLQAIGTALMLLITFWRFVWAAVWWCVGALIVLAIIKGAFLIVFAL